MKIAVIVLNFNGKKYIGKCLESLRKLQTTGLEIKMIVVDNASSDGSVNLIKKDYPDLELIASSTNNGYAQGNNIGIAAALAWGADWIWIVNPDIQVGKDALLQLIELGESHPRAGIIGSKVYYTAGFESHPTRYAKSDRGRVIWYAGGTMDWDNVYAVHLGQDEVDRGRNDKTAKTELITGASMFLRSAMLDQIGMLDRKYFLYFEENDLCQRAKEAGWELWYQPLSTVWHANAQSTVRGSVLVDYYTTRNRMLFTLRWAPLRSKIAVIRESIRLALTGRKWQKRGVIDFYLGRFGQGSYVN